MLVRLNIVLLATICAWVVGAGCASKSAHEAPTAATDRACAPDPSDPLHRSSSSADTKRDPEIESILTQPASDWRLVQLNRRMYQSLHALDVALLSEQRLAACERPPISPALEASSDTVPSIGAGARVGGNASGAAVSSNAVGSSAAVGSATAKSAVASSAAQSAMASGTAAGATRSSTVRNTGRTAASGGGGNGATAPKITPGSDNDIVARRLRKAAEQESNPTLRAKLWKEYTEYIRGTSGN